MPFSYGTPYITRLLGGYSFSWPSINDQGELDPGGHEYITLKVRRVRETSSGISAEISLDHLAAGTPPVIDLRVNLSTKRGRDDIVKRLRDLKVNEDIEKKTGTWSLIRWDEIIEQVAGQVIELERKGEPIVEITSNEESQPLKYLIAPIAPLDKPTVLFGDPDSGKSQLLSVLGLIVSLPWYDNPLHLTAPAEKHNVLFLDYEADEDDWRRQLKLLVAGMDLGYAGMFYRRCSLPLADDCESIGDHVAKAGADVLFVDSISLACGGDLNNTQMATAYFRALRQLKMTSISVAHTNKDRESKSKTILGSVLFEAGARSIWEVRGQSDKDTLDIGLFHRKSNLAAKSRPLGYRFTYASDGTEVQWLDPKSIPDFVKRMSYNQQVLAALARGKLSTIELVGTTGLDRGAIDNSISRLSRKGQIIGDSDGWGLPVK